MDETRWERWGAASGFGAILAGAAAMIFERGTLSASDPVAKIVAYYTDNHDALRAQALLFVIGAGFFLWFAGSLRSFLARAEGGTGRLSMVAYGAGVASTVVTLVALAFQVGLAGAAGDAGQPALVGTMDALFVIANLPLAVMLMAIPMKSPKERKETAGGWREASNLKISRAMTTLQMMSDFRFPFNSLRKIFTLHLLTTPRECRGEGITSN